MRTLLNTSRRSWYSGPTILCIVSAALLLLLILACHCQMSCLWAGLQWPAAASPSPAVAATAKLLLTSPEFRIWALSIEIRLLIVQCHFKVHNTVSDWIYDLLRALHYFKFHLFIISIVNSIKPMVYWCLISEVWNHNPYNAKRSDDGWITASYWMILHWETKYCQQFLHGNYQSTKSTMKD